MKRTHILFAGLLACWLSGLPLLAQPILRSSLTTNAQSSLFARTVQGAPGIGTNITQTLSTNGTPVEFVDSNAVPTFRALTGSARDALVVQNTNGATAFQVNSNGTTLASNLTVSGVANVRVLFSCANYGTNYDYGWDQLFNEDFVANITSTTSGQIGQHPWALGSSGTLPAISGQNATEMGAYSYLSLVTTQSTSGRILICPGPASTANGFTFTNAEFYCESRFRVSHTNVASDVATWRIGFGPSGTTANGEYTSGIYFMINTNANTNTLVCVTSRNSTYQFTYTSFFVQPMTWYWGGWYLDATGTNCVFMAGLTRKTMTAICTNTLNIPGNFAFVTGLLQADRVASSSGLLLRTNYVDSFKLWVKDANY